MPRGLGSKGGSNRDVTLEHYRTHDRCISATMRALGYPGRGTLRRQAKTQVVRSERLRLYSHRYRFKRLNSPETSPETR
ncbi:hypothetical protein F9L04_18645 [Brucella anthropi]|uniref:Uncharacterized protein n=1 Tax=Brucella anthropi TaxID=529 RepID=A0A6L3Z1Q8_BRUAN|nr:hypothetical protein F9K90_23240 [Brucella anthropi]KAB2765566.1 hypothetical protein F9L04_18645 [Brucella anthropi]